MSLHLDYSRISPQFWLGETGKSLRGDAQTQVVALYLLTSPHATWTGVYHCPVLYIAHETGSPLEGASQALERLIEGGFCDYEAPSEVIFVRRMAAWQIGESLSPHDKRVVGLRRDVDKMPSALLKQRFLDLYGGPFHLILGKPLASPLGAPSKPIAVNSTVAVAVNRTLEEEAPSPKRKPKGATKTPLPEDFTLTPDLAEYATERLPHVDAEALIESFRGKAQAKGWEYANWRQAFQEFIRNASPKSGHFAAGQYPRKGGNGVSWD